MVPVVVPIGAFLVVALIAVVVLLATERGAGSGSVKAKVVSVSMRQPGIAPSQMVCATGNGGRFCTAIASNEPGAPFSVGDCVSIATEGTAGSAGWKPRSCD